MCRPTARSLRSLVEKVIVVLVGPSLAPVDDDLLLLAGALGDGLEQLLELVLGDLGPQLAAARQHDEAVLDVGRAVLPHEPDAAQPVGRLGVQDLVQDVAAGFGFCLLLRLCVLS